MYLLIMNHGISAPIAAASVLAVMAMVAAMIFHNDRGPGDDYFPEI